MKFLTIIGGIMTIVGICQLFSIYMDSSIIGYFTQGGRTVISLLWIFGGGIVTSIPASIAIASAEIAAAKESIKK